MQIAILRFSAMGDVAMTVPVVNALALKNPNVNWVIISQTFFQPMFQDLPANVTFQGINLNQYKGIGGLYRLFRQLKKQKIDVFLDWHDVLRTKILRFYLRLFSPAQVIVFDKGRVQKKNWIKNHSLKIQLKSTQKRYFESVKDLQSLHIPEKEGLSIATKTNPETLIGIAPFAQHKSKSYPPEKMEKVIAELDSKSISMLIFGAGQYEQTWGEKWENKFNCVRSMIGKFSFANELKEIKKLHLMVSMDSGNAHLAAIYGIPVVSIWGGTHPNLGFLAFGQTPRDCILPEKTANIKYSTYGKTTDKFTQTVIDGIEPQVIATKIFEKIT